MKLVLSQTIPEADSGRRLWLLASALLAILLASLLGTAAIAQVPACVDVFPAATTSSAQPPNVLTLPAFPTPNDGALNVGNNATRVLAAGDHYFTSVSIGTRASLVINGPVRIFVRDNAVIENNATINAPGAIEELVMLVYGLASIGVGTIFNGILYAQGPVTLGNNAVITGAITSRGTINRGANTVTNYDQAAVEAAGFGGLCVQPSSGPDHLRLQHGASGLTCSPETITVQACADTDCSDFFTDPVSVTLSSPAGNWQPNPVTFEQSGQVSLQVTSPGTVILNAVATNPEAEQPTRCFNAGIETNCQMEWFDSGFVLDLPDHVAATTQAGSIAAVRRDDASQACVPAFSSQTRTAGFWFDYLNPTSGSQFANINGQALTTTSPGTPLELDFDANGVASLALVYTDAGALDIHALYEGSGADAGLVMSGQTETIARPGHFTLVPEGNPAATDANGPVYRRAGELFGMAVAARNANGNFTPNFGRELMPEGVLLETALLAPAGGAEQPVAGAFNDFGYDCNGNSAAAGTACGLFSWPEVGIIELTPRLASGNYLGSADVVGVASGPVGRFIPDHFTLSAGLIRNRAALTACVDPSFTYIGERFDAEFSLTARNTNSDQTFNYHADFARLVSAQLGMAASDGFELLDASIDWFLGSADAQVQARMPRLAPDGPFDNYQVATNPTDDDGVAMASFDLDLSADGVPDHALINETTLRFGRLAVDNSIGSEHGPVALPWRAETWSGATWIVSASDHCTVVELADQVMLTGDGGDSADGDRSVVIGASGSTEIDGASALMLDAGRGHFLFTAPGAPGWVDLGLVLNDIYPYLRDDLADSGDFDDNPGARATFGLFSGDRRRILLQEVAPN